MDATQAASAVGLRARALPRWATTMRVRAAVAVVFAAVALPPTTTARPSAPTGLVAIPGPGTIEISWRAPTSAGTGRIAGVRVYRDGKAIAALAPGATSYVDSAVEGGAVHAYRVAAFNRVGEGTRSGGLRASGLTVPDAPRDISHDPVSVPGGVVLEWVAPIDDGGSDLTGYEVYRDNEKVASVEAFITTYTDEAIKGGQDHTYEVAARNELGVGPRSSPLVARVAPPPIRLSVSSDSREAVRTRAPLIAGVTYVIEVSGIYAYGRGEADAECSNSFEDPQYTAKRYGNRGVGDPLDLLIGDIAVKWEPVVPTPQGCSVDHVYRYKITPAATGVLAMTISDLYYGDNRGVLLVQVFPQG